MNIENMNNTQIIDTIKISYFKHFSNEGTVYNQRLRMDRSVFERLQDAIHAEISFQFPRKNEYIETSGGERFLTPLKKITNTVVFINHTQRRFINLFLKLPLKDRNTSIYINA